MLSGTPRVESMDGTLLCSTQSRTTKTMQNAGSNLKKKKYNKSVFSKSVFSKFSKRLKTKLPNKPNLLGSERIGK